MISNRRTAWPGEHGGEAREVWILPKCVFFTLAA